MFLKKYIDNLRAWHKIARTPHAAAWMKIVQDIMDFAYEVNANKRPMLTQLRAINMGSTASIIPDLDIVSLWAGVGEQNPITRLKHLREQINMLRATLIEARALIPDTEENKVLLTNIHLILKVTD